MGKIEDMTNAPEQQALDSLDVQEFVQRARRFNAATKTFVMSQAIGFPASPEVVIQYGSALDEFLSELFPGDYKNSDSADMLSNLLDDLLGSE